MKPKKLYVVHMYRWGDEDAHSYIEGVYDNKATARKHGKAEQEWRDNKYEPKIWTHPLNEPRKLKYMTDAEINKRMEEARRTLKKRHPSWFDKDGKLKL